VHRDNLLDLSPNDLLSERRVQEYRVQALERRAELGTLALGQLGLEAALALDKRAEDQREFAERCPELLDDGCERQDELCDALLAQELGQGDGCFVEGAAPSLQKKGAPSAATARYTAEARSNP
jgi:hypothetical protein